MSMKRAIRGILRCGIVATVIAVAATATSIAQENEFRFGPPLRSNYVFGYKYTERVNAVHEIGGTIADSSVRVVTYFVTQRQILANTGGPITVEANIDSMTLDVRGIEEHVTFNTQQFVEGDWKNARHREVLGPSSIVNRLITANVSPYGEILDIKSEDLENVMRQAENPGVDDFTRVRIAEITTKDYLSTVFFPWRMLPLGRSVGYDRSAPSPLVVALDRLAFRGTGTSHVTKSPAGEPVLRFEGRVSDPILKKMTIGAYSDPLEVKSAEARIAGELTLEEDGVVRNGWMNVTGTVTSDRAGVPVTSRIRHEVYVELMGMVPFASK